MAEAPFPPQLLAPDPLALYGRTDEAGNGPVELVQTSPAAGDTIVRNANGYWVNQSAALSSAVAGGSLVRLIGALVQTGNVARPARSNVGSVSAFTDGALAATGVGAFVPVTVAVGDVISKVSIPTGATAGSAMTHQFAALYEGHGAEPAKIEQSTDTTSAAIAAKTFLGWTLTAPVTITAAMAPHGFIYAEVAITATTIPTVATYGTPEGINYQWGTNAPLFFSFTAGSALAGTAAAKIEAAAAKVVAPVVVLT